eukprot:11540003-Alexandrium_andersonii.AAC.1
MSTSRGAYLTRPGPGVAARRGDRVEGPAQLQLSEFLMWAMRSWALLEASFISARVLFRRA